jgi:K+/H+ antiporter YhaU regulatory subunit KhtT
MTARLLNTRNLKAGWSGLTSAIQEIATRTDRVIQLARMRIALWELNRELQISYREFGQRVAELALTTRVDHTMMETLSPDDPELIRAMSVIERLRARIETLIQQLAALHLEAPEESGSPLWRRLHAAGLTELVAVIPARSPHANLPISNVQQTADWLITAIIRNGTPFVPDSATTLQPGDELVLFGSAIACERSKLFLERTEEETYPQSL